MKEEFLTDKECTSNSLNHVELNICCNAGLKLAYSYGTDSYGLMTHVNIYCNCNQSYIILLYLS